MSKVFKNKRGFIQHYFFSFKKSSAGFTLLELLVAMGIFSLVILAATWIFISGLRYNTIIWDQLQGQTDGRRAVKEIMDIVRKAEESSIGSYSIVSAEDNELILYANVDADSYREKVRFWLDDTTLKRGITKPSGDPLGYSGAEDVVEISHYVVNIAEAVPLFEYYDETYTGSETALITPADVASLRIVKVQLEIEKDPDKTPIPLHVESMASVRNLKTN